MPLTLSFIHYFLFPDRSSILLPNTIIFSNLKYVTSVLFSFWDQSKDAHFSWFSFNSKYLIIFVQGTVLGSQGKKGINRGAVQREEHQRNNDNTVFPHFYPQKSKSLLGTQNSHCQTRSFDNYLQVAIWNHRLCELEEMDAQENPMRRCLIASCQRQVGEKLGIGLSHLDLPFWPPRVDFRS